MDSSDSRVRHGVFSLGGMLARYWHPAYPLLPWAFTSGMLTVAAMWDRIETLYRRVIAALSGAPGVLVASGHSSHGYAQGTNIYFTFVMKPDPFARAEEAYLEAWGRALQATLDAGGTISHHHGIGRLRAGWLERELASAYPLLRDVKRALDPSGIMNPGALIPTG